MKDWLLLRAKSHWALGRNLPTALFNELLRIGVDVDAEQQRYQRALLG